MSATVLNLQGRKLKLRKWYAGFLGDKQLTRWDTRIDKVWKLAMAAKATSIRYQRFLEPPKEASLV